MAIRMELRPNEALDRALKRFKKMCDREGLNRDIRRNAYFEKQSEKNKRKAREREKEIARQIRLSKRRKSKQTRPRG